MREYYQTRGYMNNDKWNLKCGDTIYQTYMLVRMTDIVLYSDELYNITAVQEYIREWPLNRIITKFGVVRSTRSTVSFGKGNSLCINQRQFKIEHILTEIK